VTDFLSVLKFPVFNIADACISLGVVVLFLGMWFQEREKKASQDSAESVDDLVEEKKSDLSLSSAVPSEDASGE
jgi:hypothetical protein